MTKEMPTFEIYEDYFLEQKTLKQSTKSYKVETKGKMNGTEDMIQ